MVSPFAITNGDDETESHGEKSKCRNNLLVTYKGTAQTDAARDALGG